VVEHIADVKFVAAFGAFDGGLGFAHAASVLAGSVGSQQVVPVDGVLEKEPNRVC
jgi:hypothetical protein